MNSLIEIIAHTLNTIVPLKDEISVGDPVIFVFEQSPSDFKVVFARVEDFAPVTKDQQDCWDILLTFLTVPIDYPLFIIEADSLLVALYDALANPLTFDPDKPLLTMTVTVSADQLTGKEIFPFRDSEVFIKALLRETISIVPSSITTTGTVTSSAPSATTSADTSFAPGPFKPQITLVKPKLKDE